jgi:galactokinase
VTITTYAPGRAELLGNHTDYNEGVTLSVTVERGTTAVGHVRDDYRIHITTETLGRSVVADLRDLHPEPDEPWANYPLGVVAEYQKRGLPVGGFELDVTGNLPLGAGLSSSASLSVATALFLQSAFDIKLPRIETARIAKDAENHFVGVQCGLLDPISCLFSRENCATFIDCRTFEVRHIPIPSDVTFVVADTGVKHPQVDAAFAGVRASCMEAAALLRLPALRDATMEDLDAHRLDLPDEIYHRARHVVSEISRVFLGAAALEEGDLRGFGKLMLASHASSQRDFGNSCPELDELVNRARCVPGCFGARLSGRGFGGTTINCVSRESADVLQEVLDVRCFTTRAAQSTLVIRG